MAPALGVDKIFGRGTTPREVASYLVHALAGPGAPAPDDLASGHRAPDDHVRGGQAAAGAASGQARA
jgi:hypothetical protein